MDNTIEVRMTGNAISDKIKKLVKNTNRGLYERSEVVRLTYLALLSGESIFLLGPPGTAKSLLSRKLKDIISDGKAFEYLMNPNTRQEELFGPIAISQLKNDKFVRVIDGYLPDSDIVFLDEIWKSESSILNSLLTIINEKIYKNGQDILNVPMKLLIGASNELPEEGVGLEALYDRFIIRYYVNNTSTKSSFENVILGSDLPPQNVAGLEKLTTEELIAFKGEVHKVVVPKIILKFIHVIKNAIADYTEQEGEEAYVPPYISDRRWKKIVKLLRTSALADGRNEVGMMDLLILPHVIWDTLPQQEVTTKIFNETWSQFASSSWWFDLVQSIKSTYNHVMKAKTKHVYVTASLLNHKGKMSKFMKYELKKDEHGSLFPGYKYIWFEREGLTPIIIREGTKTRLEVVGSDSQPRKVGTTDFYLSKGSRIPKEALEQNLHLDINWANKIKINTVHQRMARTFEAEPVTNEVLDITEATKDKIWNLINSFDESHQFTMKVKEPTINPVLIDNYKSSFKKMQTKFSRDKAEMKKLLDAIKEKAGLTWL